MGDISTVYLKAEIKGTINSTFIQTEDPQVKYQTYSLNYQIPFPNLHYYKFFLLYFVAAAFAVIVFHGQILFLRTVHCHK